MSESTFTKKDPGGRSIVMLYYHNNSFVSIPLCEGQAKKPTDEVCSKKQHQKPCLTGRPKKLKDGVMVVLLILNMILLFSFTSLVFVWRGKRHIAMEPRASHICVPSTEFYNDTCPASVTKRNDYKECCGKVSAIVEELLSKSMKRAFDENYPSRLFSGSKTMCTMKARQQNIFNANGFGSKKDLLSHDSNEPLKWAQRQSTPSQFIYLDGKVYVTETGYYFVHSQIKLGPILSTEAGECVANRNSTSITYYHKIKHFSYRQQKEMVLLENVRHHCIRSCQTFNTTMTTGAIIKLEERDHVYVVTSHPGHVIPCEHDNRFTVFNIQSLK